MDFFFSYRDIVVDYDDLRRHVWGEKLVNDSTIRELINRLRRKIPHLSIKNVYGHGYICTLSEATLDYDRQER